MYYVIVHKMLILINHLFFNHLPCFPLTYMVFLGMPSVSLAVSTISTGRCLKLFANWRSPAHCKLLRLIWQQIFYFVNKRVKVSNFSKENQQMALVVCLCLYNLNECFTCHFFSNTYFFCKNLLYLKQFFRNLSIA